MHWLEPVTHLDRLDLRIELTRLVGRHARGNDGARDAARAPERRLGREKDVGHILVLAQEGQVEEDLDRLSVGREDDELADAAVKRLGRLVGALFELVVVRCLLDQVEDLGGAVRASAKCVSSGSLGMHLASGRTGTHLVGELRVGERERLGVDGGRGGHGVASGLARRVKGYCERGFDLTTRDHWSMVLWKGTEEGPPESKRGLVGHEKLTARRPGVQAIPRTADFPSCVVPRDISSGCPHARARGGCRATEATATTLPRRSTSIACTARGRAQGLDGPWPRRCKRDIFRSRSYAHARVPRRPRPTPPPTPTLLSFDRLAAVHSAHASSPRGPRGASRPVPSMRTSMSSDRSGEDTPIARTSRRPFDGDTESNADADADPTTPTAASAAPDMPLPLPAQRNRVRRLASKPLKIAGSIRRGLSPRSNGGGAGGATTTAAAGGIGPSHLGESVIPAGHTHEMQGMALQPPQHSHSVSASASAAAAAAADKDATAGAMAVRGRTKPLEGEEPVVLLRVRVVRCEGLVAKDRNGTSDP